MIRSNLTTREVGIEEFSMSPEFCNRPLFPRQLVLLKLLFLEEMEGWEEDILDEWIRGEGNVEISPLVRERRDWLRDRGYSHFGEYDAVAGRRASKNFIVGITFAKIAYEVQRLGDPGAYYGIDPSKEIYFTGCAVALDQAKKTVFADFVNTMTGCAALQPHIGKVLEETFRIRTDADRDLIEQLATQGLHVDRDFSKLRVQAVPANSRTVRGITSMAICFDEMGLMMEGESASTGSEMYAAAEPSIAQFGKDGMIVCQSSPSTKDGQFYLQFQEAMSLTPDGKPASPHMLGFKYPSWELYRGYTSKHARKILERWGHEPRKSAIMVNPDIPDSEQECDEDRIQAEKERSLERAKPVKYKVERRAEWQEVLDAFLQPHVVDKSMAPAIIVERGNPDGTDFVIPVQMQTSGSYEYSYYGHLDPSSTTAGFGFALGHAIEVPDANFENQMGRHVQFDIARRWDPANFPGHTIDYYAVLDEVIEVVKVFRPKEITFDQFNSVLPIQHLRKELTKIGIHDCRVYEVTATNKSNWAMYDVMRTAMNLGLVHIPNDCIIEDFNHSDYLSKELKRLQEKRTPSGLVRVEKSTSGEVTTKDVADCYDRQTEILTKRGWVSIADVTKSDVVATRTNDGAVEWHQPTDVIARHHRGVMYHLDNARTSFMVTPGHNMLVGRPGTSEFTLRPMDTLGRGGRYVAPRRAEFPLRSDPSAMMTLGSPAAIATTAPRRAWTLQDDEWLIGHYGHASMAEMTAKLNRSAGSIYNRARKVLNLERGQIGDRVADRPAMLPDVSLIDFGRFVGMWLADGSKNRRGYEVIISQKRADGCEWIEHLLSEMAWPFIKHDCGSRGFQYGVKSYELREWLRLCGRSTHELRLPDEVFEWPREALEALIEGFTMGDGHTTALGRRILHSTSRALVDDLQRVVCMLGLSGRVMQTGTRGDRMTGVSGEHYARHDRWALSIYERTENASIVMQDVSIVDFDDMVYCVTVPNHTVLTRRNGKVMWCGNCVASVTYKLLGTMLEGYEGGLLSTTLRTGAQGGYGIGGVDKSGLGGMSNFNDFYKAKGRQRGMHGGGRGRRR